MPKNGSPFMIKQRLKTKQRRINNIKEEWQYRNIVGHPKDSNQISLTFLSGLGYYNRIFETNKSEMVKPREVCLIDCSKKNNNNKQLKSIRLF